MDPDVTRFLEANPSWETRLAAGELWPGIPDKILERLGDLKSGIPEWIKINGVWEAEKEFTKLLSERGNAVGVRNGEIIVYPPIERRPSLSSLLTDELFEKMGWQHSAVKTAQRAREQLDKAEAEQVPLIHRRQLGYAGWLATNPIYNVELRRLKMLWRALPDPIPFPLDVCSDKRTPVTIMESLGEDGLPLPPQDMDKFAWELAAFLKRWGISKLVDWEYPAPQGPLFGDKDILSFVRNNDLTGHVIYIPSWYEVTASRDNILDTLKSNQRKVQGDRFIPGDSWPVSNYARYAGMFLCLRALHALELRSGALEDKSPEHELILELVAEWLNEEHPEPRGGANWAKGEGGEEDVDKASRARRLLAFSRTRLSGKMPKELMPHKAKNETA
jgi:hypothetical protein